MRFSTINRVMSKTVLGAALALGLGACASGLQTYDPVNGKQVQWLDGGPYWKEDARLWYHNTSQGTATLPIPFKWFLALEQPDWVLFGEPGMFADPQYLSRFGFIKGETSKYNEYGLPVGFARMNDLVRPVPSMSYLTDPDTGKVDTLGFTCAACHTGQINYNGTAIGIDGGQANTNLVTFSLKLLEAMVATRYTPGRFDRFAKRVLGDKFSDKAAYKQLKSNFRQARLGMEVGGLLTFKSKGAETEGYARVDALTRIGNTVFGSDQLNGLSSVKEVRSNIAPTSAPVSYPFIWDSSWFEWVQYDASIMSVGIRNSGEAMGVAAMVNMVTPSNYWDSSVKVGNIHGMEKMLAGLGTSFENTKTPFEQKAFRGLWSPKWPEDILGKIDQDLATQGEGLYKELCQSCHLPPVKPLSKPVAGEDTFWDKKFWVKKYKPTSEIFNEYKASHGGGKSDIEVVTNCPTPDGLGDKPLEYPWRLLRLPIIPLTVVGTDPAQATILTERKVVTPSNMGMDFGDLTEHPAPGVDKNLFALALGDAVQNVNDRWNKDNNIDAKQAEWLNGGRPNCLQATLAYKARPLNGVWATPPFLHNGSIPTLEELLSPQEDRRKTFWVGSKEFDPVRIGFVSDKAKGLFKFKTDKSGNYNTGHEFTGDGSKLGGGIIGRGILPDERMALIEFLKTQ